MTRMMQIREGNLPRKQDHRKSTIKRWTALGVSILLLVSLAGAGSAQTTSQVSILPTISYVSPGQTFEVSVWVSNVMDLWAYSVVLHFPAGLVEALSMQNGGFLEDGLMGAYQIDNESGILQFDMSQVSPAEPVSGSGVLITISMRAMTNTGTGALAFGLVDLVGADYFPIAHDLVDGRVTVCSGGMCQFAYLPLVVK